MGLNVYPSEDFDFVDSVQLPDLILDLFCIHCLNTLVLVGMVTIYQPIPFYQYSSLWLPLLLRRAGNCTFMSTHCPALCRQD
jgi:hypothetical protein